MRRCRNFSALLLVSVFSLVSIYPLVAEEPVFECGTAQIDITPPIPFPLDGYYNERLSTDTHDPLFAKALIFKQGDKQFAVVACDNISVAQTSTDEARRRASEQTGIPVSNIVITGTHTHTGPVITELDPAATPETNRKAIENSDHKAFHYQLYFVEKVVAVIAEAQKNLKPATVRFAMSEAVGVSFNRRFFVKGSDQVVFNPGFNNPNLIRPAAGVDPQLPILLFSDAKTGRAFASFVSFALHLDTTGGTEFSADYPSYISQVLKEKYGDDFLSVFATGTCGDINHLDFMNNTKVRKADEIGAFLGAKIAEALDAAQPITVNLNGAEDVFEWPRRIYSQEEYDNALTMKDAVYNPEIGDYSFLERVRAGRILDDMFLPENLRLDVQAISFSPDVAMVFLPGEIFVDLGLAIKKASPFKNTFVCELSQMNIIYVPTVKAIEEGSYETVNSKIRAGGGERLVESAIQLLNTLAQ